MSIIPHLLILEQMGITLQAAVAVVVPQQWQAMNGLTLRLARIVNTFIEGDVTSYLLIDHYSLGIALISSYCSSGVWHTPID
jgi:hypothetical protein